MKKRLTDPEREAIKEYCLLNSKNMKIKQGALTDCAAKYSVDVRSIQKIWSTARKCKAMGVVMDVRSKNCGNKKPKKAIDMDRVMQIAPEKRRTFRQFSASYKDISPSTAHRWAHDGSLRIGTSHVRPILSDGHKLRRLNWCLNALTVNAEEEYVFKSMENTIHIDEKWFYMQRINERFILLPHEETPHRECQHKSHIKKIMFLCAVARPIFGEDGEVLFDGKIGIWPFTDEIPAKRKSANRPRGTIELRPKPVDRDVTKAMIINKLLPAIRFKWPRNASKEIFIQQDNATPHINDDDPDFRVAASSHGFNIRLVNQPPQSPDLNINDLGFFQSIQSLQQKEQTRTVEQLVGTVQKAFDELEPVVLNKVFLSLQQQMSEILAHQGHNRFGVPHMGKDRLERMGQLPRNLTLDRQVVEECIDYLLQQGHQVDNAILMGN